MPPKKALKFNCGFARVAAYELFVNKRYVKNKQSTIDREVNHVIATMQRALKSRFHLY